MESVELTLRRSRTRPTGHRPASPARLWKFVHQELAVLVQPHAGILKAQSGHIAAAAQCHEERPGLKLFARRS